MEIRFKGKQTISVGTNRPVCDFCGDESIVKDFDCINYTIPVKGPDGKIIDLGSVGKWAACQHCAELIDSGNREGLLERGVTSFCSSHRIPMSKELLQFCTDLYEQFWKGRK